MARRLALVLIAALALLATAAPASFARSVAFVAKPSKIICVGVRLQRSSATVRCDLPFGGRRAVFLHTRAKARIRRVPRFVHPRHRSTLGLNRQIRLGTFSCTSLQAAVSCRTPSGHGFTVGPKFQLTF